ncbi:hypothetical protein Tco_0846134 [Tanacetum coccineum]
MVRHSKVYVTNLPAIGQPVDEIDKLHWFVCGLGASFETFSTAIRTTKPFTTFRDLLSQAESHEMFLKSLHVRPHLLQLVFLNKAVLDLHRDVNNANKTTLEGVVTLVTQMGVEDVGAGVPLTASYVAPMGTMPPTMSSSSYL